MIKTHLPILDSASIYQPQACSRIAINKKKYVVHANENLNIELDINDIVKNNDNLIGIVKDKTDNKIIIAWNDNTFEKIALFNINNLLNNGELIKVKAEANAAKEVSTTSEVISNIDNNNINTDINTTPTMNINASISSGISKNTDTDTSVDIDKTNTKRKFANHHEEAEALVKLAIERGMIDEGDKDLELLKIEAYEEEDFNKYKEELLNYKLNGAVSSLSPLENNPELLGLTKEEIEAHNMLNKVKYERGIMSDNQKIDINSTQTRSLNDSKENNIFRDISFSSTNNGTSFAHRPPTLEESLMNAINNDSNTALSKNAFGASNNLANSKVVFNQQSFNQPFTDDKISSFDEQNNDSFFAELSKNLLPLEQNMGKKLTAQNDQSGSIDNDTRFEDIDIDDNMYEDFSDNDSSVNNSLVNGFSMDNFSADNFSTNNSIQAEGREQMNIKNNDLSLDNIMKQISQDLSRSKDNEASQRTESLNLAQRTFLSKPLNGITKPLILGSANADNVNAINSAYKELFSLDMWSIPGQNRTI